MLYSADVQTGQHHCCKHAVKLDVHATRHILYCHIDLDVSKPVLAVSDHVRLKSACSATETTWNIEILH